MKSKGNLFLILFVLSAIGIVSLVMSLVGIMEEGLIAWNSSLEYAGAIITILLIPVLFVSGYKIYDNGTLPLWTLLILLGAIIMLGAYMISVSISILFLLSGIETELYDGILILGAISIVAGTLMKVMK
jgi:hypothetical protein